MRNKLSGGNASLENIVKLIPVISYMKNDSYIERFWTLPPLQDQLLHLRLAFPAKVF